MNRKKNIWQQLIKMNEPPILYPEGKEKKTKLTVTPLSTSPITKGAC
jgi:hypothetical protein